MKQLTQEYKQHLENLKVVELKKFIEQVKTFKESKDNYFKKIEEYLNQEITKEILRLWTEEEFTKTFYLDPQAKQMQMVFDLDPKLLDVLKTLVYCYNTNQREFNEKLNEENLREKLLADGFTEQHFIRINLDDGKITMLDDELKKLDGKKVICVMDVSKIGLLGSFDKKEELEGTLKYSDHQNGLMLIPKRCRTKGFLIRKKFYYKLKLEEK